MQARKPRQWVARGEWVPLVPERTILTSMLELGSRSDPWTLITAPKEWFSYLSHHDMRWIFHSLPWISYICFTFYSSADLNLLVHRVSLTAEATVEEIVHKFSSWKHFRESCSWSSLTVLSRNLKFTEIPWRNPCSQCVTRVIWLTILSLSGCGKWIYYTVHAPCKHLPLQTYLLPKNFLFFLLLISSERVCQKYSK